MTLAERIPELRTAAAKLKTSGVANEANTKAQLIEPTLGALGWNPTDLDYVEREVMVFDGTFLDYALKIDGAPRIYVEAKGIKENLGDKKFIAQTVNYANNDGVLWCVLTNGAQYRIYKTNEPVPMESKLLFEVDLLDEGEPIADQAKQLSRIGRGAVAAGDLDRFGERVFTDLRVRKALASLAADPPASWVELLKAKLGAPEVATDVLRRSLGRILNAEAPQGNGHEEPTSGAAAPVGPPKGQEYPLDYHLASKGALINEMFNELNAFATAIGADVTRRVHKQYIGYFRGKKSFFTVVVQQQGMHVYLGLDPVSVKPWNKDVMIDASKIGHFGMGDTQYSVRGLDQLEEIKKLVQVAYNHKG